MADPHALWSNPSNIPVCWESVAPGVPSLEKEKEWVRLAIQNSWSAANPRIQFEGWKACGSQDGGSIRIKFDGDIFAATAHLGRHLAGTHNGMTLPLQLDLHVGHDLWAELLRQCTGAARRTCIETTAVHEFGHALGLRHGQEQSGVTSPCDADQPYNTGPGVVSGPYDPYSVMNYCREKRMLTGTQLSALDKKGIRALYGDKKGSVSEDPGRPDVNVSSLPGWELSTKNVGGANVGVITVLSGEPVEVTVSFPWYKCDQCLPHPDGALRVIDGTSAVRLPAAPWRVDANGTTTFAKWTPTGTVERDVTLEFNGRFASTVHVAPVTTRFRRVSGSTSEALAVNFDVGLAPGGTLDGVKASAANTGLPPIGLTTTCSKASFGVSCVARSSSPLAAGTWNIHLQIVTLGHTIEVEHGVYVGAR